MNVQLNSWGNGAAGQGRQGPSTASYASSGAAADAAPEDPLADPMAVRIDPSRLVDVQL
ncbi:MAG TPA: hypothetical protein VFP54_05725 [Acidimicrobiales bacterium]|nr:hypothetical protein [Acidimicrobiales bacterium]